MANPWIERLEAVTERLAALAGTRPGLTAPDPTSGERWEAVQVWGHIDEFVPFWVEDIGEVIDDYQHTHEPIRFGRTVSDPDRLAGIAHGQSISPEKLWKNVESELADLHSFLASIPDWAWETRGLHPRAGVLDLDRMIDMFLVGHLEQHASQLEGISDKTD